MHPTPALTPAEARWHTRVMGTGWDDWHPDLRRQVARTLTRAQRGDPVLVSRAVAVWIAGRRLPR